MSEQKPVDPLLSLKEKLAAAIKAEKFEEAAVLRDQIRDYEQKEQQ
ncbi:UvrB/UvrC motif-containing protein [Salmonella enterica]